MVYAQGTAGTNPQVVQYWQHGAIQRRAAADDIDRESQALATGTEGHLARLAERVLYGIGMMSDDRK
jgi:hypothetical protein